MHEQRGASRGWLQNVCKQIMLYLNSSFVHPELDYLILQCKWIFPLIIMDLNKVLNCTLVIRI